MDLKEEFLGKKDKFEPEEEDEFPEDFKQTQEAKDAIADAEGIAIKDFVAKTKVLRAEKGAKKPEKEIQEEPVALAEKPKEAVAQTPEEQPQAEKQSNFAKILTIYLEPDKVDKTKEALQGAVEAGYLVAMQAGIQVTKENVKGVNSILKYLAENGYLVVISGEQVEPVFDEAPK